MRPYLAVLIALVPLTTIGADKPADIDPNTKIQGGADVRGSGANAGAGASNDNKKQDAEIQKRVQPEPRDPEKDKPTSERKPLERERDDASRGESAPIR